MNNQSDYIAKLALHNKLPEWLATILIEMNNDIQNIKKDINGGNTMVNVNKLSRDELIQLMDSASRRLNELSYANGYKDGHADGMEAERNRRSIMTANIIQKIDDLRTNYTASSCNWLIADVLDIIRDNIEGG